MMKKLIMDMPMNKGIMYSSLLAIYLNKELVRKPFRVVTVIRSCFHCPATILARNPSTNAAIIKVIVAVSMLGDDKYGHAITMLFTTYRILNKISP